MRGEEAGGRGSSRVFFCIHNSTPPTQRSQLNARPRRGADDPFFFLPAFRELVNGADVFGGAAFSVAAGRRSSVGGSTRFAAEDFAASPPSSPHASDS